VTEEEWFRFLNGEGPELRRVCRLDSGILWHIRAETNIVHIRRDYALKSVHKHGLGPAHFMMMEIALRFGAAILDRALHLTFLYPDNAVFQTNFQATIKANASGSEVLVSTFHKSDAQEMRRKMKRHLIIRSFENIKGGD
jgi:hypothetical protein